MKVLDLGAHDGFIGAWLLSQRPDLAIDGIELEPRGVQACLHRGYREVVHGRAEDAPEHFEPGEYDVVFAGELLEHVPDVDYLLDVCEMMIRPEGLVVLSTPDGTFGEGNNPHHLRVYRSIDLAELLRRRGTLHRMAVGRDGLTLVAYRPGRPQRGELAIHTGGGWMRWAPQDIETRGLGGSETAAVKLAEALEELGWTVTVYGELEQGCHGQVVYRHHQTFDPLQERDVLISSRLPELFDRPVNARVKLLWAHDTDFGDRLTRERAAHIDHVLVLSQWHRKHVERLYPWLVPFARGEPQTIPDGKGGSILVDRVEPRSKVVQIRNGVDVERFRRNEPLERQRRVLYTSSPDRGLDLLLELWPRVRERVPDAELAYAYAPVYFAVAEQDPLVAEHAQRIEKLADQPGVEALGSLSQPQLAELMLRSMVWCCPSYNTPHGVPFFETSCIGAMEAQAAGCWVVASNWGALPETVRVGALIDAEPRSEAWERCGVEAIVRGLTNELVQSEAQAKGPEAVAELGWGPVAEQITGIVDTEVTS